jgi:hypothetical protein
MERLDADLPRALGPGATAAEAITAVALAAAADRWHMAQGWLGARKSADAVRELLEAADPLPAWQRDAAATMAAMTGEDGLPGWRAIAGNAAAVAVAVAAFAESGAALTAVQAVDLKVTLWRSSPPLWRTLRMPLAATLGDLHRAIQVLFGWNGDHLHAFTVAGVRYSDPFFDLEETADEEAVRLRDAFPASARKPARYEYDFGASWVHEITRTGSSRLAPGEAVPRCLSFSGDNPVEYWNEDEPAYHASVRCCCGVGPAGGKAGPVLVAWQAGRPGFEAPEFRVGDRPAHGRDYRLAGGVIIGTDVDWRPAFGEAS